MAHWKNLVSRTDLLAPVAFALCGLVIVLDLLAYYAFGLRPLISYAEAELGAWAVLIASGWVWAARWLLAGESRSRIALAGVLTLMVALSALHPFASGSLRQTQTPSGDEVLSAPQPQGPAVVEFTGGPFSQARDKQA